MILYGFFRSSASYRVRIAMNLKGLKPEHRSVQLAKKMQNTDEFRAINPQGFVPYLIDDGDVNEGAFSLGQSLAIIEYINEIHTEPATSAYPMNKKPSGIAAGSTKVLRRLKRCSRSKKIRENIVWATHPPSPIFA